MVGYFWPKWDYSTIPNFRKFQIFSNNIFPNSFDQTLHFLKYFLFAWILCCNYSTIKTNDISHLFCAYQIKWWEKFNTTIFANNVVEKWFSIYSYNMKPNLQKSQEENEEKVMAQICKNGFLEIKANGCHGPSCKWRITQYCLSIDFVSICYKSRRKHL